jgi:hypothetical protein
LQAGRPPGRPRALAPDACGRTMRVRVRGARAQGLLRQKDGELRQANAELEERGKLLYKTKVGGLPRQRPPAALMRAHLSRFRLAWLIQPWGRTKRARAPGH